MEKVATKDENSKNIYISLVHEKICVAFLPFERVVLELPVAKIANSDPKIEM